MISHVQFGFDEGGALAASDAMRECIARLSDSYRAKGPRGYRRDYSIRSLPCRESQEKPPISFSVEPLDEVRPLHVRQPAPVGVRAGGGRRERAAVVCEMLDDEDGGALSPTAARAHADRHGLAYVEGANLIERFG
jgi:hypothetical protein